MYRHKVTVEAGSWYRTDTASGTSTPAAVFAPDGVTVVGNVFAGSGSTVKVNTAQGTAEFVSSVQTLYLKRLTYKGALSGDTPITSVGVDLTQPPAPLSPSDVASIVARLPTTYAPLMRRGGVVYLGDSITQKLRLTSGALTYSSIDSPMSWAQHLSGYAFTLANAAGVPGDTTTQMIARFGTDVAPYKPKVVVIEGGTNDVQAFVDAPTVIANLTSLIASSKALGAAVIVSAIPPRNTMDSGRYTARQTVNRWLADNARSVGFDFVSTDAYLMGTDGTQSWLTDFTIEGTHPTAPASFYWGSAIAQKLLALSPANDLVPGNQADAKVLSLNMAQIGTGGSMGTGITGSLSASWSANPLGGTVTAAASKVARTDGIQGEWQQFVISAQSVATAAVRQQISATSGFTAGTDTVYAFAEYQVGNDLTSLADVSLNLVTVAPGSTVKQTRQELSNTSTSITTTGFYQKYAAARLNGTGVLITPTVLIDPTATSSVNIELRFAGLGTVRWGRAGVMKV